MKIVYIMGAPAIGKTYISTRLANRVKCTSLINTDMIRAITRKYAEEQKNKELVMPAIVAGDLSENDLEKDVHGFIKQAELLHKGVEATLKCLGEEDVKMVIIEGIHILPYMIDKFSKTYEIIPVLLKLEDENLHFHRMVLQGEERSAYKILYRDRARKFQQYLIDESKDLSVNLIENLQEEDVLNRIERRIL